MISGARKLGIDVLGAVPWGTHICQFYNTKRDLIETLVPYFKAGLENNEFCIWITANSPSKKEAEAAMRKAVPNFSQYLANQQMEIIPHTEWYLQSGTFKRKRVLNAWIDKLEQAQASGYDGMRVTGDMAWLEKKYWSKFINYAKEVNNTIGNYHMLLICTYPLHKCKPSEIIDVERNHQFNLTRHRGELTLIAGPEYRQPEEELLENEAKYRLLLDNSNSAISYWDTEGKIVFSNKQGAKNNGLEEKDLIGKSLYELLPPKVADFHMQRFAKIIKEGKGGRFEDKFELPVGERWFSSLFQPIKDRSGKTVGVQIISDDITEQKQAEEKKRTLAKTALDGFWVVNLEGKLLEINDSYCQMIGYTQEELLKMSIQDIEAVESYEDTIRRIQKIKEQGSDHFESRHKRKDGRIIDVEVNVNYLDIEQGQFFVFIRDITEQKQAEEKKHTVAKTALDGFWVVNLEGRFLEVNDSYCQMIGYTQEELLKMSIPDVEAVENSEDIARHIKKVIEQGSDRFETQHKRKDGRIIDVEINVNYLDIEQGLLFGSLRDITEQKQAEIGRMMPLRPTSGRRMIELQKRFIKESFEGLEDQEIIELLLSLVLPARKARQLAMACLERFKNLRDFLAASPKELEQIGITPASMFCIKLLHELPIKILKQRIVARSIYKSSSDVFNYLYYSMRDLKNEVFKVIYLDNRSQIIDTVDLFEGTRDIIPIRPREIVESAIEHNAAGLIFVHNHPTGDPTPSKSDKHLTRDLVFVGNILQINVLDHIIIGADSYFSFADDGLIHKYQDNFFNLKIRGVLASATIYRNYVQSHKGLHSQP